MKAFRFSLEAVQTLRHRQEQQAMEQYVRALLARQQALDQLEIIRERIRGNQQELSRLLSEGCAAAVAAQVQLFERSLEKQQADRVASLAMTERRVNATFQAMVAARQKRKMVESYRKRQQGRHQRAEAREEQKLLDDLTARRERSIFSWNPTRMAL
ncbi:MAG: flagellar FliJ family protein [Verrucomicrobiota bacterium]|jgi:flagellar export protein FliJ